MKEDGTRGSPVSKRPYFRPTTADRRRLMFSAYEQTGSPRRACAAAHVCLGTFYRWRLRFLAGGYAALDEPGSHRPHSSPQQLPRPSVDEVVAAKRGHPAWGRRRIADELAKGHGWQAVASASQVRRILIAAGLWPERVRSAKEGGRSAATPTSRARPRTRTPASSRQPMRDRGRSRRSGQGKWGGAELARSGVRAGGSELRSGNGPVRGRPPR
jgi:transposase